MNTQTVIVASTNPVKLQAAREGFIHMFPHAHFEFRAVQAESGVPAQPMSADETLRGARGRVHHARQAVPDAAYVVGIEGGLDPVEDDLMAFAWVVIVGGTREGKARSGSFVLPHQVRDLIRQGHELGHADDIVFSRTDSKRQNGSIGLLTGDVIDRTAFYAPAVVMALIPFLNAITHPHLTF